QMTLAQQIQAADERIAKLEEELDSERANLEAQQKDQLEIQAAQGKAATREAEATEQLNELRLAVATERQRHESLIAQRQPMSAREAALDSRELAAPDVEKVIAELTRQLDNMGPVNLDAVHEYDELEERYKFLEGQNNDLTNARRELLDVIAQINSTTRKLFAETFA